MGLGDERPERIALNVRDWRGQQSKKLACHGRLPCANRTGEDRDAHRKSLNQMAAKNGSVPGKSSGDQARIQDGHLSGRFPEPPAALVGRILHFVQDDKDIG
jgi:hypothetical protein